MKKLNKNKLDLLIREFNEQYENQIIIDFIKESVSHGDIMGLEFSFKNQLSRFFQKNPEFAMKYGEKLLENIFQIIRKTTDFDPGKYQVLYLDSHPKCHAFKVNFDNYKEYFVVDIEEKYYNERY